MYARLESPASTEVLSSWKDIAKYLKRGVRTVQRWESELALPVRRRRGKRRAGVSAIRSEIDIWLSTCPTVTNEPEIDATLVSNRALLQQASDLIAQSRLLQSDHARLRADVVRLRKELVLSVHRFVATVRGLPPEPAARNRESAKAA
jgi:hypothetical protein